ncbi:MAG TPA: TonB-dependent receptor [Planctomycetota bacterium]|nr:TonB-dependent receptor [Planctomycetota bacterium]
MPSSTAIPALRLLVGLVGLWGGAAVPVWAQDDSLDLGELSLEALLGIEVESTAAGRKAQTVRATPAAVHVLTADDLRRSGATTLAEALRLVPGLHVARINSSSWAVSARGFNDQYANKMLVLVDGRSVYTPLFSGTYWDALDLPLDTVERIEVVLGPGAVLWGANAVNGVISIVTKSAHDSLGTQVSGLAGNEDIGQGYARHGGRFGESGAYRIWTRYAARDDSHATASSDPEDAWEHASAGFRADWKAGERDSLAVDGGISLLAFDGTTTALIPTPPFVSQTPSNSEALVAFLRGRWTRELGERSSLALQGSLDTYERDEPALFGERRTTLDLDMQHRFPIGGTHDLMWGLGFRGTDSEIISQSFALSTSDSHRYDNLFSAFVQDEITLVDETWNLILGAKVQHNDYTGFEFQPNVRTLWNASETQVVWAGVSRAVRSPSQIEADGILPLGVVPGAPPTFITAFGDDQYDSEELVAFEVGYRNQFSSHAAIDVAAFYNVYDDLRSFEPGVPFLQDGLIVAPIFLRNLGAADTWGGEVALDWRLGERTRVRPTYSLLQIQYRNDPASADTTTGAAAEGAAPQHMASLWINHDLARNWDLDAALFYVDELADGAIPEYWRLDLRAEWRPNDDLRVVLGAQGLMHDEDPEFATSIFSSPERIESAFYLGVTWSR